MKRAYFDQNCSNKFAYHEMGLFRAAGLFQSYTNFINVIAQRTKIIKLNHLYLYDTNANHI